MISVGQQVRIHGREYVVGSRSTSFSRVWLALNERDEIMCALRFSTGVCKRTVTYMNKKRWPWADGVLPAKEVRPAAPREPNA